MPTATNTYSPERVDAAIRTLQQRIKKTCVTWGDEVQAAARQNAPWSDRGSEDSVTGKTARESLEAQVGVERGRVLIVLRSTRESSHSWKGGPHAPVGAFLELGTRRMRKFSVIWPTLERTTPILHTRLRTVMNP